MTGKIGGESYVPQILGVSKQDGTVRLKLKLEDGTELNTTIRFNQPMNNAKVEQYLKQVETKNKLEGLIERHQLLTRAYSDKENVKVKLSHSGGQDTATIRYLKVSKEGDGKFVNETKLQLTRSGLDQKINSLSEKKEGLVAKTLGDNPALDKKTYEEKLLKLQDRIDLISKLKNSIFPPQSQKDEEEDLLIHAHDDDIPLEHSWETPEFNRQERRSDFLGRNKEEKEKEKEEESSLNPFYWNFGEGTEKKEKEKEKGTET